jgi:hypothetical protein
MKIKKSLKIKIKENIKSILRDVFEHTDEQDAVVVYDTNSTISTLLYSAYKEALPNAIFIDFNATEPEKILEILTSLQESDFIALIQSTNFRLNTFRIRVELLKRQIIVIEYPYLNRMSNEEFDCYIDSMKYEKEYYCDSTFESEKLNIQKGQVVSMENTIPAFDEILELIHEGEGSIWVRELGFGLNRAFSKTRTLSDTGTYERMCGVHLSLGKKHRKWCI